MKKKTIKRFIDLYYRDTINGPNQRMPEHLRYHWYGKNSIFFDNLLEEVGHEDTFDDFCDAIKDLHENKYTTIELLPQERYIAMYNLAKEMLKHYRISKLYSATWYRLMKIRYKLGIKWNYFLNWLFNI